MASESRATLPVTITVHVPISAISAVRNATDNHDRILAIASITSHASFAVVEAIRKPEEHGAEGPHLLSLPRELRDRIWMFATVRSNILRVYPQDYRFPALCNTCEQTRAEAAPIYFGQNRFMCGVTDLKGAWMGRWTDIALGMLEASKSSPKDIRCELFMKGVDVSRDNWGHLKQWLKVFHEGRCVRLPRDYVPRRSGHRVAHNAFNIVEELLEDDWSRVSAVLEHFHDSVVRPHK
ncbi:hypothetical protein LTR36_001838 [Oleoguttula mirabilis]|uniref:Uncharacterized protein n=1 Tax=Oleoguttula mirabilis TaxID=1507867 RepID=A0AAV9JMQ8_9PEZI|nr:hypothetical protein LTR36_001838 [Oleoguttula mirabilis]